MKEFLFVTVIFVVWVSILFMATFLLDILIKLLKKLDCFLRKKALERDFMKILRKGKSLEICVHDYKKFLGIPIAGYKIKRSSERVVYLVNPIVKLVKSKVVIVRGVMRIGKMPLTRISAKDYLSYCDPKDVRDYERDYS